MLIVNEFGDTLFNYLKIYESLLCVSRRTTMFGEEVRRSARL